MPDSDTTTKRRSRPASPDSDLGPVDTALRGRHGRKHYTLHVTPLGWAQVSPEVRAQIDSKTGEVRA